MLSRRRFLKNSGLLASLTAFSSIPAWAVPGRKIKSFKVQTLTKGAENHFFGGYGIDPWSKSGRYIAALRTSMNDRLPTKGETAEIGLVNSATGVFERIALTQAWNFQTGANTIWLPSDPENKLLYNDLYDNDVKGYIIEVRNGKKTLLKQSVMSVSTDGKYVFTTNLGRLTRMKRSLGISGLTDPNEKIAFPETDGIFRQEVPGGESRLILTYKKIGDYLKLRIPEMGDFPLYIDQIKSNEGNSRIAFTVKYKEPLNSRFIERSLLMSCGIDGLSLRLLLPFKSAVSNFNWRNNREILATFIHRYGQYNHVLFTEGKEDFAVIGYEVLIDDGHCSLSKDGNWVVTDRCHDTNLEKSLWAYNLKNADWKKLGSFPMFDKQFMSGDTRCDLNPRWNPEGNRICFDALEPTGKTRQLHIAMVEYSA